MCFDVLVACEGRVGQGATVAARRGVCFGAMTYVVGDYGRIKTGGF